MWSGFQPLLATVAIAWAANFGVAMFRKCPHPDRASRPTWAETVGSVTL